MAALPLGRERNEYVCFEYMVVRIAAYPNRAPGNALIDA